jgi:large subunit ribosomal protein L13
MAHFIIDATNKKLGRIATEVATLLRGKNVPSFTPYLMPVNTVTITNASKIDISAAKLEEEYKRYSGYPGGLTHETRGHLLTRRGYAPVFEHTIRGMLPPNRLRDRIMKHLTIVE